MGSPLPILPLPVQQLKSPGLKVWGYLQVKNIIMDTGNVKTLGDRLGLHRVRPIHRRQNAGSP
jgi:hypothetical protein